MRVLTVPPTNDGWVALQPEPCGDRRCCFGGPSHMVAPAAPAVGDVLGLVERCERCDGTGRIGVVGPPCGHCHDDPVARLFGGGVKSGAGYLLTGFVKVVEVRAIVTDDGTDYGTPGTMEWCGGDWHCVYLWDDDGPTETTVPPNAVPGGVAIKVEPCDCPVTDEELINHTGPCWLCEDLPRPVTLHGDAPIQEVEL